MYIVARKKTKTKAICNKRKLKTKRKTLLTQHQQNKRKQTGVNFNTQQNSKLIMYTSVYFANSGQFNQNKPCYCTQTISSILQLQYKSRVAGMVWWWSREKGTKVGQGTVWVWRCRITGWDIRWNREGRKASRNRTCDYEDTATVTTGDTVVTDRGNSWSKRSGGGGDGRRDEPCSDGRARGKQKWRPVISRFPHCLEVQNASLLKSEV